MAFIGRTKDVKVRQQKFIGDGSSKIFTLDWIPLSDNQLTVYLSGVYLNDKDFVYKHPNKILLADAPDTGVELIVMGMKVADFQSTRHKVYTGDGVRRIFDCGFTPPEENALIVTVNGDVLQDRDFILASNKIIINSIPTNGVKVEIRGIHDVIDPSGNVQASNSLSIQRTRSIADGLQNIHTIHQKPTNENNLMTIRGTTAYDGKVSNQHEYALVNEYKYVHKDLIGEGTLMEYRGLTGSAYSNLNRRVMMSKNQNGIPATITKISSGTSGYVGGTKRAIGGSGTELYVVVTNFADGSVAGVTLPTSGWSYISNKFATGFNASEVLTIQGGTNDATIRIDTVTNNNGQRYFDINNYNYDQIINEWTKDTSYVLPSTEQHLIVTVDGIVQPYNAYTVEQARFLGTTADSGVTYSVIDIGTVIGVNDQASTIEVRDISKLISNADVALDADTGVERIVWTTTGSSAAMDLTSGYDARTSDFTSAFNADIANKQKFMVMVNGVVQDVDTWALTSNTLTIGGTIGHANDAGTGAHIRVEMIYFTGLDSTNQDARQIDMTGAVATGTGDHKFVRLYDKATGLIELHASSDASAIVVVDGVLQNDNSYFIIGNKLCFFDEAPDPGSIINVKMLKCSTVVAANRRKHFIRGDGSTTVFSLPFTSTASPVDVGIMISVNGQMLRDDQFSLTGTTLTFNSAPTTDAFIEICAIFDTTTYAGTSADTNLETKKLSFITDGLQQIYDMSELVFEKHSYGTIQDSYNEQKTMVFLNGELKGQEEYIIVGSKLYMTAVPPLGLHLEVVRFI